MSSVIFLGTGGGRMVVLNQFRSSGGFWLNLDNVKILQDPGPGSLVMVHKLKLKPRELDAIILSHRHIDHSNDVNVMTEAMTGGGFHPHGKLITPGDCLNSDPVVLEYIRPMVDIIEIKEGMEITIGSIKIKYPIKTMHSCDTFGPIYEFSGGKLGYIPDTEYFPELAGAYKGVDYLVINVVRMKTDIRIRHLNISEAEKLVNEIRPKKAILTHFGLQVLKASPGLQAKKITENTGIDVVAARDGMKLEFDGRESLDRWV
ncbi:MAG: MBL fold metallo-hydrolase [Candidatus Methanoperedenaceae archaeon]|nr:MBL fold metallo-hydrolase [Candidatus Methanoperedenaceae archaeon]